MSGIAYLYDNLFSLAMQLLYSFI